MNQTSQAVLGDTSKTIKELYDHLRVTSLIGHNWFKRVDLTQKII